MARKCPPKRDQVGEKEKKPLTKEKKNQILDSMKRSLGMEKKFGWLLFQRQTHSMRQLQPRSGMHTESSI